MATSLPRADHVLSALPTELVSNLFAKGRTISLEAKRSLFLAGDHQDGCYRLDAGSAQSQHHLRCGQRTNPCHFLTPVLVGEMSMLDGAPRSTSVEALQQSKLCFISSADFEAFANAHPELYRHGMILLARRLRTTNDALVAATFMSLRGRVARVLLSLAEAFGRDVGSGRIVIRQKVTQNDLAAMAGISRENVSRILSYWTRGAVISRFAGYYCLEKRTESRASSTCENAASRLPSQGR